MKVTVNVHYHTVWGQRLRLCLADGTFHDMNCASDGMWMTTFDVPAGKSSIEYSLELLVDDNVARREWRGRCIELDSDMRHVEIADAWRDMPQDRPLYSSFFSDVVFAHDRKESSHRMHSGEIRIEVEAPALRRGEILGISGSSPQLGRWDTSRVRGMSYRGGVLWEVVLDGTAIEGDVEYKFVVMDSATGAILGWEKGDNRRLMRSVPLNGTARIVTGLRLRNEASWRGAGVAVPVFSLRSERSFGTGEIADLNRLVDWCTECGMSVIQILPVNDTTMTHTWRDSYPYNTVSSFALHPLYIRIEEIGLPSDAKARREMKRLGTELNELPQMDYERVMAAKERFLRILYAEYGEKCAASRDYAVFFDRNASWLKPYAVFSALRDESGTSDFSKWGEFSTYDAGKCDRYAEEHPDEVGYYCFVQYHLDRQLREAHEYARSHGVALKGDIPIGVARTGVDAWMYPQLFDMESSAGAPPDDFSTTGQNWGFPVYDWVEMSKDGYAWWRARLAKMAEYFDAYRMDHILGFFRIWEVPVGAVNALLGEFNPSLPYSEQDIRSYGVAFDRDRDVARNYHSDDVLWLEYRHGKGNFFYPRINPFATESFARLSEEQKHALERIHDDFYYYRHNELWRGVGRHRLSVLVDSTPMLACGEDLGMIPACVPEVMRQEQILSLEIERMPKSVDVEFSDLSHYPYLSVCTTSSHDTSTLRGWWSEDKSRTERYFRNVLHHDGAVPEEATPEICAEIMERHLSSPSMLAIMPLQDWLAIDGSLRAQDAGAERINVPADAQHYWRYRMHLTLECLVSEHGFCNRIAGMVKSAGR